MFYFHSFSASDDLNKFLVNLMFIGVFLVFICLETMPMWRDEMVVSMEENLIFLDLCNKKIYCFMNLLLSFKVFKHWHHWGVFLQHNPKRKNHKLVLMNGTWSKFWGFVNQMHPIIQLHPHCYPNGPTQIESTCC